MFARLGRAESDPFAVLIGFKGGRAINLRIVPCPLQMPDAYLSPIEPPTLIGLGCMRWKGALADEVRR
jgi:hypothetical protein